MTGTNFTQLSISLSLSSYIMWLMNVSDPSLTPRSTQSFGRAITKGGPDLSERVHLRDRRNLCSPEGYPGWEFRFPSPRLINPGGHPHVSVSPFSFSDRKREYVLVHSTNRTHFLFVRSFCRERYLRTSLPFSPEHGGFSRREICTRLKCI